MDGTPADRTPTESADSSAATGEDPVTWTSSAHSYVQELYEQTWLHYRHLVSQRTTYLGFLFTASFGTVGIGVPLIISVDRLDPAAETLSLVALLAVYQGFCLFVFASVRRSGLVMARYQRGLRILRQAWGRSLDEDNASGNRSYFTALGDRALEYSGVHRRPGVGLHQVVLLAPMGLLMLGAVSSLGVLTLAIGQGSAVLIAVTLILVGASWTAAMWTIPVFIKDGNVDRLVNAAEPDADTP